MASPIPRGPLEGGCLFECLRHCKLEDWEEEEDSGDDFWDDLDDDGNLEDFGEAEEPGAGQATSGGSAKTPDMLGWQKSVWRQAPQEGCVSLDTFLDYHARVSCPGPPADARKSQAPRLRAPGGARKGI